MSEVDLEKVEGRRARAAAWMNNQDPPEGAGERAAWLVITGDVPALIAELEQIRHDRARLKTDRIMSVVFGHHGDAPKPFALLTSTREPVALGAEFPDGAVAMRLENNLGWQTWSDGGAQGIVDRARASTGTEYIVLWLSDELEPLAEMEAQLDQERAVNEALRTEHHEEFKQFERLRDHAFAEMEEVIQDLRQDLQRHSDARIVETRARCRAEQVQFTHSMFAYPHLLLWHALFDGTRLCRCWHSREMRGDRRAVDGG